MFFLYAHIHKYIYSYFTFKMMKEYSTNTMKNTNVNSI